MRARFGLGLLMFLAALPIVLGNYESTSTDEGRIPHRQDRPPNRPYSPDEALKRMVVPEGFHVELVAAEPDIVNPIAFTFDDKGRIWVTESVEYPRNSPGVGRDRIKILEDTNHDGKADKITVFADNLNIPSGIEVGFGGVWVLNAPDLLFYEEQNGKAVRRKVVLTGFGRTDTHELPNTLTWGPDGWLYGLNGVFNQSVIESEGKIYKFNCALFRVHPRTHRFELISEGTSNPWGLVWDPFGSAIVSTCHWAKDHVFHFVETGYYQRQAGAYPPYTMKIGSISDHGHQKTAYCGLAYMDSDAYPQKYRDKLYIGNIHGGCINVDVLSRKGSTYLSQEAPDFLSANDAWFMPVSIKMGPDGCLYVLDWYDRYHCAQDARRDPEGVDRGKGRLYRVRYKGSPRAKPFDLTSLADAALMEHLGHPNIFFRQRAQRLLSERRNAESLKRLQRMVLDGRTHPKARMHALWAIVGAGPLPTEFHQSLLTHVNPTLRAWGVRAASNMHEVAPEIRSRIESMVYDVSPDVQLQVAIASRKIEKLDALTMLVKVAASCGQDRLIPYIVWPNLHPLLENQSQQFVQIYAQIDLSVAPGLRKLTPRVVDRLLNCGAEQYATVVDLVELVARHNETCAQECLAEVAEHMRGLEPELRSALAKAIEPTLRRFERKSKSTTLVQTAQLMSASLGIGNSRGLAVRRIWLDRKQPPSIRLQALDVLISLNDSDVLHSLPSILEHNEVEFLTMVLPELGRIKNSKLAEVLLARYPSTAPDLKPLVVDLLMQREAWASKLLAQIKSKKLPQSTLDAGHLRKIMDTNDRNAIWLVEEIWGKIRTDRNPVREKVVAETLKLLQRTDAEPHAGQKVFRKTCAQCHKLYGEGHEVGPDLTGNGRGTFQQLVSNVLDPSLVIGRGYQTILVITDDGRNLTGIPVEDNEEQIVLRLPGGGTQTIRRNSVEFVKKNSLSMMPEGTEQLLSPQELADLFRFLAFDKHPDDPEAKLIPGARIQNGESR